MKALYRKYRPCKLADVVGQEQVTKLLENALAQGKISHAYLFIGPRGTGKTSVARIFAHEINQFEYEAEDDYVDIVEIDGASNRGIDDIRELREKAIVAPSAGKYKVYIIDEVHMLTKEAFNALLKTLEEPPEHVVFIMATTDAYKVPVTITSRAQTFTFKLADFQTMFDFLKSVAKQEKIKISDEALEIIVRRGGGSFRDSLSLLDQISTLSDEEIGKELVISAMGLPEDEKIAELLKAYSSSDAASTTTIFRELLSTGLKAMTLAEEIISYILTNPQPGYLALLDKLVNVKDPFAEAKLLVALVKNLDETVVSPKRQTAGQRTESFRKTESTQKAEPIQKVGSIQKAEPAKAESVQIQPPQKATRSTISHDEIFEKIKATSEVIYSQITKCVCKYTGTSLDIYPRTKIVFTILSSVNNKKILTSVVGEDVQVIIHEASEYPKDAKNDGALDKISAIMGGEVRNDHGGKSPF